MDKFPMTPEGEKILRDELNHRKNVERLRISKMIGEAREHGDLKENAEYHSAREEQGLNEARIRDIESRLSNAEVIDISQIKNIGKVVFGSTVTLINVDTEDEKTYKIVGEDEADIKKSKISITSPIARSLIGKEEGDIVVVNTPGGQLEFEIDGIMYN